MENQKDKKINWLWAVIVLAIIGIGFLVALNNRYEARELSDCPPNTAADFLKSKPNPCIRVFDKWTGKAYNK